MAEGKTSGTTRSVGHSAVAEALSLPADARLLGTFSSSQLERAVLSQCQIHMEMAGTKLAGQVSDKI